MKNPLIRYLILLALCSFPFLILAGLFDATQFIPIKLPLSALMVVCPLIAALLTTHLLGQPPSILLRRGVDFRHLPAGFWRMGTFALMPLAILLAYGFTRLTAASVETRPTPILSLPLLLVVYFISGYCEEIGWTAVCSDLLLKRFPPVTAGLLLGGLYITWHLIPFIQTHNSIGWIVWQSIFTVISRVLMIKVYQVTQRSVVAPIALHATYNTAWSLMPYYGSSYDPMMMAAATLLVTLLVFILPQTHRPQTTLA